MILKATVYSDRELVGKLEGLSSPTVGKAFSWDLCAGALLKGSPPDSEEYRFLKVVAIPQSNSAARAACGSHCLVFQAVRSGGRTGGGGFLAIHGGDAAPDGSLRPTSGTLRLHNTDLAALVGMLDTPGVTLVVAYEAAGFFRRLLARKVASRVSGDEPQDEFVNNNPLFWTSLPSDDYSPAAPLSGGGGEFGGGGASGDWTGPADEPLPLIVDPFGGDADASAATPAAVSEDSSSPADESSATGSDSGGTSY